MAETEWRLKAETKTLETLLRLKEFLSQRSVECYLSGGFVRDALLGRPSADIDVVVGARAMELAPEVAHAFGGKFVALDEENQIARVVLRRERPLHSRRRNPRRA